MREAWRVQKNELKGELSKQKRRMDVFLIYTGKELPVYSEVSFTIQKIIEKLLIGSIPKKLPGIILKKLKPYFKTRGLFGTDLKLNRRYRMPKHILRFKKSLGRLTGISGVLYPENRLKIKLKP